jgi:alanyl-tRNA synthetase
MRTLQKEREQERLGAVRGRLRQRAGEAPRVGPARVLAERVDGLAPQEMRELADGLLAKLGSGVVVLGRTEGEKASLLVAVTDDLKDRVPAGGLVKELAGIIGGGGGGRPDRAEAGGREPQRLDEALSRAVPAVAERLEVEPSSNDGASVS